MHYLRKTLTMRQLSLTLVLMSAAPDMGWAFLNVPTATSVMRSTSTSPIIDSLKESHRAMPSRYNCFYQSANAQPRKHSHMLTSMKISLTGLYLSKSPDNTATPLYFHDRMPLIMLYFVCLIFNKILYRPVLDCLAKHWRFQ